MEESVKVHANYLYKSAIAFPNEKGFARNAGEVWERYQELAAEHKDKESLLEAYPGTKEEAPKVEKKVVEEDLEKKVINPINKKK